MPLSPFSRVDVSGCQHCRERDRLLGMFIAFRRRPGRDDERATHVHTRTEHDTKPGSSSSHESLGRWGCTARFFIAWHAVGRTRGYHTTARANAPSRLPLPAMLRSQVPWTGQQFPWKFLPVAVHQLHSQLSPFSIHRTYEASSNMLVL